MLFSILSDLKLNNFRSFIEFFWIIFNFSAVFSFPVTSIILMVNYRRNKLASKDAIYFITMVTYNRIPLFVAKPMCDAIVQTMNLMIERFHCSFPAWIIMPDHIHWLIKPNSSDYSKIVFSFKRIAGDRIKKRDHSLLKTKIWQNRYWEHTIRDDTDLLKHLNYIHFNPVKHGLQDSPSKWKYSSFRRFIEEGLYLDNVEMMEDNNIYGSEYD